jgi:hypothetical protein
MAKNDIVMNNTNDTVFENYLNTSTKGPWAISLA